MTNAIHDRVLLDTLGDGDGKAFWTLWQQYQRHLYGICLRHMNGARFDAADAVSRSMLVAHAKLPAYARQIENLEAWLTRLTSNVCLDMHRERQRALQGRVSVDEPHAAEEPALRSSHSPEDDYLAAELRRVVAMAIGELPPSLREAAHLRFVQEASYAAMARTLSITEENARKRVQHARAILRRTIKAHLAPRPADSPHASRQSA